MSLIFFNTDARNLSYPHSSTSHLSTNPTEDDNKYGGVIIAALLVAFAASSHAVVSATAPVAPLQRTTTRMGACAFSTHDSPHEHCCRRHSRRLSPPPPAAALMSNISFSLINQAQVVSSLNGHDCSPARLMKEGEMLPRLGGEQTRICRVVRGLYHRRVVQRTHPMAGIVCRRRSRASTWITTSWWTVRNQVGSHLRDLGRR